MSQIDSSNDLRNVLCGAKIWLSGAIPEIEYWNGRDALDREILEFVQAFTGMVMYYGGELVHGSHPSLTPVIVQQARSYWSATERKAPITLAISKLWSERDENVRNQVATWKKYCTVVETDIEGEGEDERDASLHLLREYLADNTHIFVAVGGKLWTDISGRAGIPAEFRRARERGLPCFVLGGFGGAAEELTANNTHDWLNGLSPQENIRLATTTDVADATEEIFKQLTRLPLKTIVKGLNLRGIKETINPSRDTENNLMITDINDNDNVNFDNEINIFLIMPFGEQFYQVEESINLVLDRYRQEHTNIRINCKSARTEHKHYTIYENIMKHIDDCDMAIIDMTKENKNVILEFGLVIAKEKQFILITQDTPTKYKTDYRLYVYTQYSIDKLDNFKDSLYLRLKESFRAVSLQKQITIQQNAFEVTCYKDRSVANLGQAFSEAQNRIRIIQTNLHSVEKFYAEDIEQAIKKSNGNIDIRFLTLDPESYFAAVRASQLGMDVSDFRQELRQSLSALQERFKTYRNIVEIRVYDDFPTQICFLIDNDIYNCVVSKYQPSRNNCMFKLDAQHPSLHTSFNLHFTSVWRDSNTTKKYYDFSKDELVGT